MGFPKMTWQRVSKDKGLWTYRSVGQEREEDEQCPREGSLQVFCSDTEWERGKRRVSEMREACLGRHRADEKMGTNSRPPSEKPGGLPQGLFNPSPQTA